MKQTGSREFLRAGHFRIGHLWLCVTLALSISACDRPSAGSSSGIPATAPAAAPSVYNTLAVIATPAVRSSGLADLVAADLGRQLPGVRLVERERLDAAAGELTAATLLGADAGAGAARLKLGQLVRADALVVLAEEEGRGGPANSAPAAAPSGAGKAGDAPTELQLVIADCRQGARLRVVHLPVNAGDPARLSGAVATAVRDVRTRYPEGVRWIVGTSPFVSRNLLHDYDPDQRRFAAVLDNALSLQPAVAVLESQEARGIAAERAVGGTGAAAARTVPLIVEGEFEVRRPATFPTTGPAAADWDKGATVRFSVKLADAAGTKQTIERELPLADAGKFLGVELPADILRLAPLADLKPLPPDAQFKALAARADEFARILAFDQSTLLREAALLLNPSGDGASEQRKLLVDEYVRLTQRPVYGVTDTGRRRALEQDVHDQAWERGLQLLEYLVRNRQVNRRQAIRMAEGLREYTGTHIPDGPPRLTQFLADMLPRIWELPREQTTLSAEVADNGDRTEWFRILLPGAISDKLCWTGGHVMTPAAYDTLLEIIERRLPADQYPLWSVVSLAGFLPRTAPARQLSGYSGPSGRPPDATITNEQVRRDYESFLNRLEQCGKPGYAAFARFARLYREFIELNDPRGVRSAEAAATALRHLSAFESEYTGLRLGGAPPPGTDPILRRVRDMREQAQRLLPAAKRGHVPTTDVAAAAAAAARAPGFPTTAATLPGVSIPADNGRRLWFVPLPVQEKTGTGRSYDYGELHAQDYSHEVQHMLSCGQELDVIWSESKVRYLTRDNVLQTVLVNEGDAPAGRFTDAKWDGKRLWLGRGPLGIQVLDAAGRLVAQVGEAEGLPPVSLGRGLLIEPLSDGRVFATGTFDDDHRGWCAVVETTFGPDGRPAEPPRVQIVHQAIGANILPAVTTQPAGPPRIVPPGPDVGFVPTWVGRYMPALAGAAAAAPGGPYVLVGRRDSVGVLLVDLADPRKTRVSVLELPFPLHNKSGSTLFSIVGAGDLLALWISGNDATLFRSRVTAPQPNAPGTGPHPLRLAAGVPLFARAKASDRAGGYYATPLLDILETPDALYVPGTDGWVRVDPQSWASEWLPLDEGVYRAGRFGAAGISGRYGPVTWGKEFCRLVTARERPHGALEVKGNPTQPSAGDAPAPLWVGDQLTPSGEVLIGAPKPIWGPAEADRNATRPTTGPAIAGSVLALAADEPQEPEEHAGRQGLLPRELARQAVLIAARDGLGLSTRDQTLQEPVPGGAVELDSHTATYVRQGLHLWVSRREDPQAHYVIDQRVSIGNDAFGYLKAQDYAPTVRELERLSRGEFVEALKPLGLKGRGPVTRGADAPLPDGVQRHLSRLSFTSQFAAVREAHATIRQSGETPALLGALVRGYANLGQLTDFLWNASHRAFTARSLLYAERMVAADPASADARYHRAYARALAGLHAAALSDLEGADDLAKRANATPPAWAGLVRNLCRYETAALRDVGNAGGERAPLASYFCVLTAQLNPSTTWLTDLTDSAARQNPFCLQIQDRIDRHAAPSAGFPRGPAVLAEDLVTHLPEVPSLPDAVRRAVPRSVDDLRDAAAGAELARRLVSAGEADVDEPSLAALGRMVQEHQFVNVQRRAWHVVYQFGGDAAGEVAAIRPLVADHPYRALVESYAFNAKRRPDEVLRLLGGITPFDIEYHERLFLNRLDDVGQADSRKVHAARDRMRGHFDDTAYDLEQLMVEWRRRPVTPAFSTWILNAARRAETVSPWLPEIVAVRARLDWKSVEPRLANLERESGDQPAVSRAVAEHYLRAGQYGDAERWLRRYLTVGHDSEAYRMLARCRLAAGDEAGWLTALDEFLRRDETGLSHARVRVEISQHFMSQGKYDRAEPYAREAAASGAEWAMLNAANCYEGLARWDEAERWVRHAAEGYHRPMAWYLWCVRTGHGDVRAAESVAADYVGRTARAAADPIAATDRGLFYLVQGRTADALATYNAALDGSGSPFAGLHAALLHDAAHDSAARDAALDAVVRRGPAFRDPVDGKPRAHFVALASLFRKAPTDPAGDARLDRNAVKAILAPLDNDNRLWALYFLGRFEDLRGQKERATEYYRRCAESPDINQFNRTLAVQALRKQGIEVKTPPPPDPEQLESN